MCVWLRVLGCLWKADKRERGDFLRIYVRMYVRTIQLQVSQTLWWCNLPFLEATFISLTVESCSREMSMSGLFLQCSEAQHTTYIFNIEGSLLYMWTEKCYLAYSLPCLPSVDSKWHFFHNSHAPIRISKHTIVIEQANKTGFNENLHEMYCVWGIGHSSLR